MSYEKPYEGIRVVDLSQGVAGPYGAMLLAQYGADVIKVEPPEGDWSRSLGRIFGDHTAFSIAANLGKRSIVLDLKSETDKQKLWKLIDGADVFLEGFRPGVIQRLGFAYEEVAKQNPRIIYLSISGFGQRGPLSKKPAMDPVLQAFTGYMFSNRDAEGRPRRGGVIAMDMATAMYGFQAVSAALFGRQKLDHGRFIDLNLMQGAANFQVIRMMQTHILGEPPLAASAPNGPMLCKEGWIAVFALKQKDFHNLCRVTGQEDFIEDPRLQSALARQQNEKEINARFAEVLSTKTAKQWNAIFTEAGLQNERILDYPEFLQEPQVAETELISWLPQPGMDNPVPLPNPPGTPTLTPGTTEAHAPALGEHTEEISREYGL